MVKSRRKSAPHSHGRQDRRGQPLTSWKRSLALTQHPSTSAEFTRMWPADHWPAPSPVRADSTSQIPHDQGVSLHRPPSTTETDKALAYRDSNGFVHQVRDMTFAARPRAAFLYRTMSHDGNMDANDASPTRAGGRPAFQLGPHSVPGSPSARTENRLPTTRAEPYNRRSG